VVHASHPLSGLKATRVAPAGTGQRLSFVPVRASQRTRNEGSLTHQPHQPRGVPAIWSAPIRLPSWLNAALRMSMGRFKRS